MSANDVQQQIQRHNEQINKLNRMLQAQQKESAGIEELKQLREVVRNEIDLRVRIAEEKQKQITMIIDESNATAKFNLEHLQYMINFAEKQNEQDTLKQGSHHQIVSAPTEIQGNYQLNPGAQMNAQSQGISYIFGGHQI